MTDFVHLHVHSQYSMLDGAVKLKNLVRQALETVETDPASYPTLTDLPPDLVGRPNTFIRKVPIRHQKHDYRMVYLHQLLEEGDQQVDFLYVCSREDDYRSLDWDVIRSFLQEE